MKNLKLALKSLGYREHPSDNNKYLKPFGYNVFVCHIKEEFLNNYFYDLNNKFSCWDSTKLDLSPYKNDKSIDRISQYISYLENYQFHVISVTPPQQIGFISMEESLSVLNEI